jgi:hypothetical protein
MRKRQRGMTFLGLLCVLALVGVVVYAGIRLIPCYLNYMKVVSALTSVASEFKGGGADELSVRRALEKNWGVQDITNVDYKEVEITKADGGGLLMHVHYDDVEPYISNVSLSVSFDKTVAIE